jgi:prevent-host-death family protein
MSNASDERPRIPASLVSAMGPRMYPSESAVTRRASENRARRRIRQIAYCEANRTRTMGARDRSTVLAGIREQLSEEPLRETRSPKPMRPTPKVVALGITWELRIAAIWRVFYSVDTDVVTRRHRHRPQRKRDDRASAGGRQRRRGDRTITTTNVKTAKNKLSELLSEAQVEHITIMNHGRPIAILLGVAGQDLETCFGMGEDLTQLRVPLRQRVSRKASGAGHHARGDGAPVLAAASTSCQNKAPEEGCVAGTNSPAFFSHHFSHHLG